jgi:signal transduction histidine kinase
LTPVSRTLPDRLGTAAALTLRQGLHGYVWTDDALIVTAKAGPLVDFVSVGRPIMETMLVLVGMGADLNVLLNSETQSGKPAPIIDLPNVTMESGGRLTPRFDLSILRDPEQRGLVVFVSRVVGAADHDIEMQRLFRERLIAEEQLSEKSRALERANADLAEFAYVISHDLKAPLRAIRYLTDDVTQAVDAEDCDSARRAADKLSQQSRRMGAMLSGLLEYASIGRKAEAIEKIDTRQLIGDIVGSLESAHPNFTLAVTGAWPQVSTLAVPLDLVLRNLIENALKHHDQGHGHVEIGCSADETMLNISIRDDGPGIPEDWHTAVFDPFTTVDERSHPESSGIGLALVKKSVETSGGSIALQSTPSKVRGTTFIVRWPIAPVTTP